MNCEKEISFLTKAIKDFVTPKAKGIIIGLSGGIDSSVVAALCVKALGVENVYGVMLPCSSISRDQEDATTIAKWLDIKFSVCDLKDTLDALVCCLDFDDEKEISQMTIANAKARLRMTTLYAFAGQMGYLVAGTGNKSELMIGYLTKYGDGGIDFEPIGDYFKVEVWKLATALNVPVEIIDKKPSAGLWDGQTDEDELGMTYHELDLMLMGYEKMTSRVEDMIRNSEHKRNTPPCFERKD